MGQKLSRRKRENTNTVEFPDSPMDMAASQEKLDVAIDTIKGLTNLVSLLKENPKNGKSIVMSAGGSRGDCQPLAALGVGLKKLGFHIIFGAGPEGKCFADMYGFEFLEIHSSKAINQGNSEWMDTVSKQSDNEMQMLMKMVEICAQTTEYDSKTILGRIKNDSSVCCLIASTMAVPLCFSLSYALNIPAVCLYLMPFVPTNAHLPCHMDSAKSPGKDIPEEHWAATSKAVMQGYYDNLWSTCFHISWKICCDENVSLEDFKEKVFPAEEIHKMVINQHHRVTFLYGISQELLGGVPEDYPRSADLDGYLFLPPSGEVNPTVDKFLQSGSGDASMKPVCIGFGSMVMGDKPGILRMVLTAVMKAKVRAVILAGWAELSTSLLDTDSEEDAKLAAYVQDGNVVFASEAAHDWLYPQCCCIVHHGGSGTTAAALRAGVPSIITPFGFDQAFMGDSVQKIGCGLRLPAMIEVTSDQLTDALIQVRTSSSIVEQATAVGQRIKAENGVGKISGKVVSAILGFNAETACKLAGQ